MLDHESAACLERVAGLATYDGTGTVQCYGMGAPGLGAIANGPGSLTFVGNPATGQIFSLTGVMTPTVRRSWGRLKALYR